MQPDDSITQLIEKIKAGDEEAAHVLWNRCFPQLVRLAHGKLADRGTRMADEEDVAIRVLDSFIRAVAGDCSPDLRDRSGLWRLLSVTTFREAVDRIRDEQRQKPRVQGESCTLDNGSQAGTHPMDRICGRDPTPGLAAMLGESCERLLGRLEPDLRTMVVRRLEGRTNREIARPCSCSLPTGERHM